MGQVEVTIQVGNSRHGGDLEEVVALVDTGAVYTVLPRSLLDSLKIDQLDVDEVEFASGESAVWPMGEAWIVYGGKGRTCPVYFGPEDQYLLGVTALELHRLMVDPENQRLVPMPPVRGRSI